jgi:hypothetical protein
MTISNEDQITQFNPQLSAADEVPTQPATRSKRRIRAGLIFTLAGYAIFLLGARPSIYGLDRSPVIGFVQIAVFLAGIGIIALGAYITVQALWMGKPSSILAQIGLRLLQTGFVIAFFTGMADTFGLGSHPMSKPFFGPWQSTGVQIGELVIGLGIIMMFPFHRIFSYQPKRPVVEQKNGTDTTYE